MKTVEFIPVKEKIKMIAAQQEELLRKEEASKVESREKDPKQKGVRILPPSPVTVRKLMVEEELQHYDTAVTRTTPVTGMLDSRMETTATAASASYSQQTASSTLETPPMRPPPPAEAALTSYTQQSSSTMESSYRQETVQQQQASHSQVSVPGWNTPADIREHLEQCGAKYDVDR